MKYKISFLGSPLGSFKRSEHSIVSDIDSEERDVIITQGIYKGRNETGTKFYNISWDSITIKQEKKS